jgi:DNA-binding NarL/FixJ family response regulator
MSTQVRFGQQWHEKCAKILQFANADVLMIDIGESFRTQNRMAMVLIASPSKVLRRQWREALAGVFPMHEVGDKRALLHSLRELKPEVLFLDYDNPVFGRTCILRDTIQASPSTRVVVITDSPTSTGALAAIKCGAQGYGPKNLSKPLIRKAARVVSGGEIWIGRKFISTLILELGGFKNLSKNHFENGTNEHESRHIFNELTIRQREIVSLISTGEQNRVISSRLSISEKTVKAHLTTIFRKLHISGRIQLALLVSHNNSLQNLIMPEVLSTKPLSHPRAIGNS